MLILSRSSYIKQCVHHPYRMFFTTVFIIFLTVVVFRPPLKLLCRPVMVYSFIFSQLKLYSRHLMNYSSSKCWVISSYLVGQHIYFPKC